MDFKAIIQQNQKIFEEIISLQDDLFHLDAENILKLIPNILLFTKSKEKLHELLVSINVLANVRPIKLALLHQLFSFFAKEIHNFFSSDELPPIFKDSKRCLGPLFCLKCINIQTIIRLSRTSDAIFKIFCQSIEEYDIEYFKKRINSSTNLKMSISKKDTGESKIINAIQSDNISNIQKITSASNQSLNSKIPFLSTCLNDEIKFGWQMPSMLEYAVLYQSVDIFKYLLLNNAEITSDLTLYAIKGGNSDIIHILEREKNIKFGINDFHEAIKYHWHELTDYLHENYDLPHTLSSLFIALESYNIKYFIDHIDLLNNEINSCEIKNNAKRNMLLIASSCGYTDFVEFLLSCRNPSINDINLQGGKGFSALLKASEQGFFDIVRLLVEYGHANPSCNINFKGDLPLHLAAKNGHLDIVSYLVNKNPKDVNRMNYNGKYPLHMAAEKGYADIVSFLIKFKETDVNAVTKLYDNPLTLAVLNENIEVIKVLCENKNTILNYQKNGESSIHFAVKQNSMSIVKLLTCFHDRIDINKLSDYNQTPLQLAVKNDFTEIALFLLDQQEINLNIPNNDNRTILSFAAEKGNIDVVRKILSMKKNNSFDINSKDYFGVIQIRFFLN